VLLIFQIPPPGLGDDKMKVKKTILLIISLVTFSFCSCATFHAFFAGYSLRYYYSDQQEINTEHFRLKIEFSSSSQLPSVLGGKYRPILIIYASEGKFIQNIFINKVIVCAGRNEYNMLENIKSLYCRYKHMDYKYGKPLTIEGDYLDDIRRTGFIDVGTFVDHSPDILDNENQSPNVSHIFIYFKDVSLLYSRHKEIRLLYDFSVELITGETIIVNQEVITPLKKGYYLTHMGILPSV